MSPVITVGPVITVCHGTVNVVIIVAPRGSVGAIMAPVFAMGRELMIVPVAEVMGVMTKGGLVVSIVQVLSIAVVAVIKAMAVAVVIPVAVVMVIAMVNLMDTVVESVIDGMDAVIEDVIKAVISGVHAMVDGMDTMVVSMSGVITVMVISPSVMQQLMNGTCMVVSGHVVRGRRIMSSLMTVVVQHIEVSLGLVFMAVSMDIFPIVRLDEGSLVIGAAEVAVITVVRAAVVIELSSGD